MHKRNSNQAHRKGQSGELQPQGTYLVGEIFQYQTNMYPRIHARMHRHKNKLMRPVYIQANAVRTHTGY